MPLVKRRAFAQSMWFPTPRSPRFLREAAPFSYDLVFQNGFRFYDGFRDKGPCLLLKDSAGRTRFVLGYTLFPRGPQIRYVQRTYSTWFRRLVAFFSWENSADRKKLNKHETRESVQFESVLKRHPADFLLSCFLYWAKRTGKWVPGKNDVKVIVPNSSSSLKANQYLNARTLFDRYFVRVSRDEYGGDEYVLSTSKRRVKEILESD